MRCPGEKQAIVGKIKAIAKRKGKFKLIDCINTHFACHYSKDWQECLDAMVREGKLLSDGGNNYWSPAKKESLPREV